MRRKIALIFSGTAMLLLSGCALLNDDMGGELVPPETGETAETTGTTFDLGIFTAARTEPAWTSGNGKNNEDNENNENNENSETGADASDATEPAAAVTEDTAAETTAAVQTTTTAHSSEPAESTATARTEMPEIPARYRLSALPSAELVCAESPSNYCTEDAAGQTVLDISAIAAASGFRRDGSAYGYKANSGTATLQTGILLEDTDEPVLQTIRFTYGEQTVTVDQRAPSKAVYRLPDGTHITADQAVLLVYLCEQLAADPTADPLHYVMPIAYQETIGSETFYYLP